MKLQNREFITISDKSIYSNFRTIYKNR